MKRDRSWRRYIKEKHTLRRLRVHLCSDRYFWFFTDVNNIRVNKIRINDYLGLKTYFMSKSYSTDKWETRHKVKYSPNKSKEYWRYKGSKRTREYDKKEFLKILKEYGIK